MKKRSYPESHARSTAPAGDVSTSAPYRGKGVYPLVSGTPKITDSSSSSSAKNGRRRVEAVPEPAIRGRWIIQADEKEYQSLDVNGIKEIVSTERTATHMYFYTSDYQNEKQVKSAYACIRAEDIPSEKILGYQKETEAAPNPNFFIYDSNAKLTPYGMIVQRIKEVSESWIGNEYTKQKEAILKNFLEYYYQNYNETMINCISGWLNDYAAKNPNAAKPLYILSRGRSAVPFSFYNKDGNAESLQLFKKLVPATDKQTLQDLIDQQCGVKSSCLDGLKNCFSSGYKRMTGG
jgi:hypothetical protein